MEHEKCIELISCLLDGELSEREEAEVRGHIAACPECRSVYDAFAALSDSVSQLEEPPEGLHEDIMSAVSRERRKKPRVIWLRTLSAAACLALVVLAGVRFGLFNGANYASEDGANNENMSETVGNDADNMICTSYDGYTLKHGAVVISDEDKIAQLKVLLEESGEDKIAPDIQPDAAICLGDDDTLIELYYDGEDAFTDFDGTGPVHVKGSADEIRALIE